MASKHQDIEQAKQEVRDGMAGKLKEIEKEAQILKNDKEKLQKTERRLEGTEWVIYRYAIYVDM